MVRAATPFSSFEATRRVSASLEFGGAVLLGIAAARFFRSPPAGLALSAAGAVAALRRSSRGRASSRLAPADPALSASLRAYLEGGGGLLRSRLESWIGVRRPKTSLRGSAMLFLLGAGLAAGTALFERPGLRSLRATAPLPAALPGPGAIGVTIRIVPPSYSGAPAAETHESRISALRGSRISILAAVSAPSVEFTAEGEPTKKVSSLSGIARWEETLEKDLAIRVAAAGASPLVISIRSISDEPPKIELLSPREDREVTAPPGAIELRASASDDVGLEEMRFHYTLARGHGEGMSFKNGSLGERRFRSLKGEASAAIDPAGFGFSKGDTLVVWAEAADGNRFDGPGRSRSSARVIRWDEGVAKLSIASSALPLKLADGPVSEREILARTIRLREERLPASRRGERAREIAHDQQRLREAFSQFTLSESEVTGVLDAGDREAENSTDEGTRSRLARAVSEMWGAEESLNSGDLPAAIRAEKRAVRLLDEALGGVRMALRALAAPTQPIDPARRLTGNATGMKAGRLEAPPADPESAARDRLRKISVALFLSAQGNDPQLGALADELWRAPRLAGFEATETVSRLYAARAKPDRISVARFAAETIARSLEPGVAVRPAVSEAERGIFTALREERSRSTAGGAEGKPPLPGAQTPR